MRDVIVDDECGGTLMPPLEGQTGVRSTVPRSASNPGVGSCGDHAMIVVFMERDTFEGSQDSPIDHIEYNRFP
jgi:hypothetical protein